jgi:hypothetical protein
MSEDIIVQVGKTIRFDYFLPDVRKKLYLKHKYIARRILFMRFFY